MQELSAFGDFEIAPKKGYLSFRRKKQVVMFGPATNSKVEVGFNSGWSMEARIGCEKAPPRTNVIYLTLLDG
ncbi:MAG: hypothetical protein ABIR59_06020 [Gemmatimonadales bacterium]